MEIIDSNQLYWLTNSGTIKRLKPRRKSIIKDAIKEGQGAGTKYTIKVEYDKPSMQFSEKHPRFICMNFYLNRIWCPSLKVPLLLRQRMINAGIESPWLQLVNDE